MMTHAPQVTLLMQCDLVILTHMMLTKFHKLTLLFVSLLMLAACQPIDDAPRLVITPFPSPTAGSVAGGVLLPPADSLPPDSNLISPATAVALAELPTPTPNYAACPVAIEDPPIEDTPPLNAPIVIEEITRFLNDGGSVETLNGTLRDRWQIVRDEDTLRADIDFTGEGTAEVLISYLNPDSRAALLILGCVEGEYRLLYDFEAQDATPLTFIGLGDMNRDLRSDVLFASRVCPPEAEGDEDCELQTRLIAWQASQYRFADLLDAEVLSISAPQINDIDADQVSELVVRLENRGNTASGPLRTGIHIYDWNGEAYVLSVIQLDPPRYRIQVVFEADRAVRERALRDALPLYEQALSPDSDLRAWFNDEAAPLRAYTLYRLMIAQVASQSAQQTQTYQTLVTEYPDPETAPVYVNMARAFLESYQTSGNPSAACDAALALADDSALALLNRYGTRNPTYSRVDLCPF